MTIDSDDDEPDIKQAPKSKANEAEAVQLDLDFVFDPSGDPYSDVLEARVDLKDFIKTGSRPVRIYSPHVSTLQKVAIGTNFSRRYNCQAAVEDHTEEAETCS